MACHRVFRRTVLCFIGSVFLGGNARVADGKELSHGGTILLIGDSIFHCHEGDKRIEFVMQRLFRQVTPGARWTIFNEAHGGEYIGPKLGIPGCLPAAFCDRNHRTLFRNRKPSPAGRRRGHQLRRERQQGLSSGIFRKRIEALAGLLEERYPGAVLVMCTSMYLDPHHAAPYHIENPQSPGFHDGDLRNVYLEPYNREIRELTAARGYRLADTYRRLAAETARGNWDLRLRADEADPKDDPQHVGDMRWYDNVHPNDRGTEVIAAGVVEALLKSR